MEPSREVKYAVGSNIPANERRSYLRDSFAGYDRNRDGFLTCDELMDVWKKCLRICDENVQMERVESEVKRFMDILDKDNNGKISFEEYVDYFEKLWTQKEAKHRLICRKLTQPTGTQTTTSTSVGPGNVPASRDQPPELLQSNSNGT